MNKTLEVLEKYILYLTVFLVPLIILPLFPNPFDLPKVTILALGVALVILVKALQTLVKGSLEVSIGTFDFPIILLGIAYTLSAILRTPNKMEAFLLPGTATVVLAGVLLYLLINQLKEVDRKKLRLIIFFSGVVLSLVSLLAASGILAKIPQLPTYMKNSAFNLLGGTLPTSIFLASLLPLGLGITLSEKEAVKKIFLAVSAAVLALGLAISIFNSLPGKPTTPNLVDFGTSWAIAVDTLKESPIWGIGPGNYLTAFNRFRPLSYNQTDLWAVRFTSARDFYLTLLTETGLLGAAGLILLFLAAYRALQPEFKVFKKENLAVPLSLLFLFVLLALFPATTSLIILLFVLLSLAAKTKKTILNLTATPVATSEGTTTAKYTSRFPAILVATPFIVAVLVFFFYASRALAAEVKFKRALNALVENRGTDTYNLMREAINANPFVDRYHSSYAQVNLLLANSLAQNPPEGGLTDQDRATIAQLIQQAIREGKAVVSLNPQRAGNWELLAGTYRAITPFAEGADQFAIQTYNQSIALDPINPNLRIALGGLHYALGDYDTAIRVFELATLAKPDHANAHYNLAVALREKGEIQRAVNEMTLVLSLVNRDSDDYELARAELEALEKKLPAEEAEAGETLTPPQPVEEPVIQPPLELPEGAEPPEAPEVSPSPTPTEQP